MLRPSELDGFDTGLPGVENTVSHAQILLLSRWNHLYRHDGTLPGFGVCEENLC
jgi:hypothetical protein